MRKLTVILACLAAPACLGAAAVPFPAFKVQEIDKTLKVGYGLRIADLNADGKPDVVVADAARVVWFSNPDWATHTIIENDKAGVKPDNVCLAVHDVDGDGKLDIALGADWQPNNTTGGGSLQWLRQGKTIDEWTVHKIEDSIPTLHRIHFADATGDGKADLLTGPLKGKGSTAEKNWSDAPLELTAYRIPADPTKDKWEPVVLNRTLHVMHNFWPVVVNGGTLILTASYEGVGVMTPGAAAGEWKWSLDGTGNQENPGGSRGSSEVKVGYQGGAPKFDAAIEPFHGHQVVVYRYDQGPAPAGEPPGRRTVIDEQFKSGHALWCADLDGDGTDEVIAGFRDPTERGVGPGVRAYRASGGKVEGDVTWDKHVLDEKGMAAEDLACADLDADGRVDVVAVGRATGNVRIYWNQGVPAK